MPPAVVVKSPRRSKPIELYCATWISGTDIVDTLIAIVCTAYDIFYCTFSHINILHTYILHVSSKVAIIDLFTTFTLV